MASAARRQIIGGGAARPAQGSSLDFGGFSINLWRMFAIFKILQKERIHLGVFNPENHLLNRPTPMNVCFLKVC